MVQSLYLASVYLLPLSFIGSVYIFLRWKKESRSRELFVDARNSGLTEPSSLHPVIDPLLCIGCGSCVSACHEKDVLGIISNRAHLINPADCIGHGACQTACPEGAIKLVFGTENKGVDIPDLTPFYESTVPGIYVAGELGGMGLIKNAIAQGKQAVRHIHDAIEERENRTQSSSCWDCVIVGCGPAGIAASLEAKKLGLRALVLDRSKVGGTVAHFPRRKLVMTSPAELAFVGKVHFKEVYKEELISFWQKVVCDHDLKINEQELLTDIREVDTGFVLTTDKAEYFAHTVLLALGRRGTPRKLEVPGEELGKVVYALEDPAQYAGENVLIVGGGDSALEAALALLPQARVTLSCRSETFSRAKKKNREKIQQALRKNLLDVRFVSRVLEINTGTVLLEQEGQKVEIQNDHVIVCVGGVLPTAFLTSLGIRVTTKYGEN